MNIRICGTGSALPERKITNDDLSQIMDTSDEWISSRTGITVSYTHLSTCNNYTQDGRMFILAKRVQ